MRGGCLGGWLAGCMRCWRRGHGVGVAVPAEEGAEAEVLDDGELGEDFGVVHFEHALGRLR